MTYPTVVQAANSGAATLDATVNLPAPATIGNLLVAFWQHHGTNDDPPGWTPLLSVDTDPGFNVDLDIYTRPALGGEQTFPFLANPAVGNNSAIVVEVAGVGPAGVVATAALPNAPTTATLAGPTIAAPSTPLALFFSAFLTIPARAGTPAAGWTEVSDTGQFLQVQSRRGSYATLTTGVTYGSAGPGSGSNGGAAALALAGRMIEVPATANLGVAAPPPPPAALRTLNAFEFWRRREPPEGLAGPEPIGSLAFFRRREAVATLSPDVGRVRLVPSRAALLKTSERAIAGVTGSVLLTNDRTVPVTCHLIAGLFTRTRTVTPVTGHLVALGLERAVPQAAALTYVRERVVAGITANLDLMLTERNIGFVTARLAWVQVRRTVPCWAEIAVTVPAPPPPPAPAVAVEPAPPGTGLPAGAYSYVIVAVNAAGETAGVSPVSTVVTVTGNQNVTVALPPPPQGATGWQVYRTQAGGGTHYFLSASLGGAEHQFLDDGTEVLNLARPAPVLPTWTWSLSTNQAQAVVRRPRFRVLINGTDASDAVVNFRTEHSFAQATATATVTLANSGLRYPGQPPPAVNLSYWATVEIRAGAPPYEWAGDPGTLPLRFTGYVTQVGRGLFPAQVTLSCRGKLAKCEMFGNRNTQEVGAGAEILRGTDLTKDGHGETDEGMVAHILSQSGLVNGVDFSFTQGDAASSVGGTGIVFGRSSDESFIWQWGTPGISMIQQLEQITLGFRTFERPDGVIVRQKITPRPDRDPVAYFTEGRDIERADSTDDPVRGKNLVTVTGSSDSSGTDRFTVKQRNIYMPSDFTYVLENVSSPMLERETAAESGTGLSCEQVAYWKLDDLNRLFIVVNLTTPRDDALAPGETIQVTSPARLGVNQRLWVQSVTCEVGDSGFRQSVVGIDALPSLGTIEVEDEEQGKYAYTEVAPWPPQPGTPGPPVEQSGFAAGDTTLHTRHTAVKGLFPEEPGLVYIGGTGGETLRVTGYGADGKTWSVERGVNGTEARDWKIGAKLFTADEPLAAVPPYEALSDASAARSAVVPPGLGPPAGWERWPEGEYDDGGWDGAATADAGPHPPVPGTARLWHSPRPQAAGEEVLIRQRFSLPAGDLTVATLDISADNEVVGAWVNNVQVYQGSGDWVNIPFWPGILEAGGVNLIAVHVKSTGDGGPSDYAWVSFKIGVA